MPDRPLRIGVDARPLWVRHGGIPRYLRGMLRALAERGAAIDVRLYTPHGEPPPLPPPASMTVVPVRGWAPRPGTVWLLTTLVRHLRRTREVDVLWIPQPVAPLRAPAGIPLVLTVHDLVWHHYPHTLSRANRALFPLLGRRSLRTADRLVADSAATLADVEALIGELGARARVVQLAADDLFRPRPEPERRSLLAARGLDADAPFHLSVGTLEPRKNLGFLLDVWAADDGSLAPLWVVGPGGWGDVDLGGEVARRGLDGRVRALGTVDDDTLCALYQSAIALLFPTLYEGFGLPPLEAGRLGTPTVAHDLAVLREGPALDGVLLPVDDPARWRTSLLGLQRDRRHRDRLGRAASERAWAMTWDAAARAMIEVFEEVAR